MKYLIAGLGNIGIEYAHTRHNIGFDIADALAKEAGASFEPARLADHASFKFKGRTLHLIKPTTYMNLSGKAVRYWLQYLKIPLSGLIVAVDDIALPFGKIRIRLKGQDAGHNGLKDIGLVLESTQYARLRFGIGSDFHQGMQADYVLSTWTPEEARELPKFIENAANAIKSFCTIGPERTMNLYN